MSKARTALVTGAAQGIGRGIAERLLRDGMTVGVVDVNESAAQSAAADLGAFGEAFVLPCDITDAQVVETSFRRAEAEFGTIDVLVNNAGWSPNKPFLETSREEWGKIVAINYLGALNCTRSLLDGMIQRERGRVIFISSDAARVGTPREAVYAGAKAGVIGFAKSLAAEVARASITVNVVCPSTTDTPLLHSILSQDQLDRRRRGNPMGRIGTPADIANMVSFFASDDAAYVTGQVISVNGGSSRVG